MASFASKLAELARGPKGRELIEKAKEYASKPENRRKIDELRAKLGKRR